MHLLFKDIPQTADSSQDAEEAWARTSFVLQSHEPGSGQTQHIETPKVTMLCFGAVKHFKDRCIQMRISQDWERILDHPAILVVYFLDSWYERVDKVVWNAHERARVLETVSQD
jgi:hypothetical protein